MILKHNFGFFNGADKIKKFEDFINDLNEDELVLLNRMVVEKLRAIHQVKTTANFAARNKIVSWFVGGLNYQIEHHLFPRVSHIHYPALSSIVKRTCKKFNMPYNEYPTMLSAIFSHLRMMKFLGKNPLLQK